MKDADGFIAVTKSDGTLGESATYELAISEELLHKKYVIYNPKLSNYENINSFIEEIVDSTVI